MKLILMSPSRTQEHETKIVTSLFEHGLETYHLRKPSMNTRDMRAYIEAIPEHFHDRIVIHSHHNLASRFNLKGIHLTRTHIKRKFSTWFRIRTLKLKRPGITVSTTFHKVGHVYENKKVYDYALIGTIFDGVSGKFNAGYSEHNLTSAIERSAFPLIARGGISIEHIPVCAQLGFGGMIFYSAVWKQEKPLEAFCDILNRFRELDIRHT